jgi:hypothetical protein
MHLQQKGAFVVYVLIGVILLAIIVPILLVLPSTRQKERMQMRMIARAAGVSVELTSIDDPNPKQDKYITYTGKRIPAVLKVVAYRLQRKREREWRQLPKVSWCLSKDLDNNWHWKSELNRAMNKELAGWLQDVAPGLPADVIQIEEDSYTISVYWHERIKGEEQVVLDFLKNSDELLLIEPSPGDAAG